MSETREASSELLDRMVASVEGEPLLRWPGRSQAPRMAEVESLLENIRRAVFVGYFDESPVDESTLREHLASLVGSIRLDLERLVRSGMRCFAVMRGEEPDHCAERAAALAEAFVESLPALREAVALDVQAAFDGDPAAQSTHETVVCYPGVHAVFAYRVAHRLRELGAPLAPRMIAELAHSRTGIDIHPGATIGRAFFIDHGTGVVIGETAHIGDNVKVYQGVTIGAKSFPKDERGRLVRGVKRHPTIGDRVTLYAESVILGGDTIIGDDCVISGSVFVTQSVPDGHVVRSKKPELVYRANREAQGNQGL